MCGGAVPSLGTSDSDALAPQTYLGPLKSHEKFHDINILYKLHSLSIIVENQ